VLLRWLSLPSLIAFSLLAREGVDLRAEQSSSASGRAAQTLVVDSLGRGVVTLDGPWQFHLGDDLRWADSTCDDSNWEQLRADEPWGVQGHEAYTGFAWYRLHIRLATLADQNLAILIPPVDDAYELYWNGMKIGSLGSLPPHAVWHVGHRQSFALPVSSIGESDGVLALRVWKAPLSSVDLSTGGGLNASPIIGDTSLIGTTVANGDFQSLLASLYGRAISYFFMLMAILSFFAWMRNRAQKLFLWFSIWLMSKVALYYLSSDRVIELISSATFLISLTVLYSIEDCSVFLLLLYLFNLEGNRRLIRWAWIVIAINASSACADGLLIEYWANAGIAMQWADAAFTAVFQLTELFVFVLIYRGLRRELDLPRKLVALMAFLVYLHGIVRVFSAEGRRFTHWTLYRKLGAPLFHIFGAGITSRQVLETTLILVVAYALSRFAIEQQKHEQAIETELKAAREVQRVMIPETAPEVPGYDIASVYQPAREVGGDFFQIIPLSDKSTLVILGDVSGKGMKAAMNVSLIIGTLRTLAEFESNPASILSGLNRRMIGRLQGGFVTALVFKVDPSGQCNLANAGHLEPFLNGKELKIEGSLPLGIVPDAQYEQQSFTMSDGDSLTIYTDGVLEACNEKRELYGFERMRILLASGPSAAYIAETARTFGQEDDITVLTIHRSSAGSPSRVAASNLEAT